MSTFLDSDFFARDVLVVARDLVGVELVWNGCSGIIVETEAYAAEGDLACHTATRPSTRDFCQTRPAGAAYVYLNYGMYWLFNLLVKGGARDGLVLVRAIEPVRGIEVMKQRRQRERLHELCSGPGKLGVAFGIHGSHHGTPLVGKERPRGCGLRASSAIDRSHLVEDVRVGIREAADYPWRYLVRDNPHVSVPFGKVKPLARP